MAGGGSRRFCRDVSRPGGHAPSAAAARPRGERRLGGARPRPLGRTRVWPIVEIPGAAPFIGVVGLARIAYEAPFIPAVELAWRLAKPWWGRGYATEAARATIDYGFTRLGLDELIAVTVPANRASRAVMERLGMTRDPAEDFDHPRVPPGPLQRHVLYRLRRREARG
jgi:RimJ/RimL family protein N-acetyltransferase